MRWQDLFADLEGQLRSADRRERDAEVAELTRHERASVGWLDRAAGSLGARITVHTIVGPVRGRLDDLGSDWLLLEEETRRSTLLSAAAVAGVTGLTQRADTDPGRGRRFGLRTALRALSRDRAVVTLGDAAGGMFTGTIDRVGADYLDLAEHPADVARRPAAVTGERLVTFSGLVLVRRA